MRFLKTENFIFILCFKINLLMIVLCKKIKQNQYRFRGMLAFCFEKSDNKVSYMVQNVI